MLSAVALVLSAVSYAVGIAAQTAAVRRTERRSRVDPGLLARLARDRIYLVGFTAQVLGFLLAFVARATLPLYLVQAAATSAVGLAAVIGLVLWGWRIGRGEVVALVVMVAGLLLLVGAARPSTALDVPPELVVALVGALVVTAAAAVPAFRSSGGRAGVVLGVLAGLAFAVLAIAARPLADGPLLELPFRPLFWIVVVSAVFGQGLLAAALQRTSTTAAAASMDATTVLVSSAAGLAVLGDAIVDGRGPWVLVGVVLVVAAVLLLARMARSQPEISTPRRP